MSKTLELSDKQHEILTDVLQNLLGDMSYEISDTDTAAFKDQLKERRDEIQAIADQLKD